MNCLRIGAAGWNTVRALQMPENKQHAMLKAYGEYFNCVEVSSTFFRVPSAATFANWAALTPADFRFALRIPEAVSHVNLGVLERRARLRAFLCRTDPLAEKLGLLILTLPVDVTFTRSAMHLLSMVKDDCRDLVVCQTRHPSWSTPEATRQLQVLGIPLASMIGGGSVRARPPLGDRRRQYWRLHHAPGVDHGSQIFSEAQAHLEGSDEVWIICDNCHQAALLNPALLLTRSGSDASQMARAETMTPGRDGRREGRNVVLPSGSSTQRLFHLYFLRSDQSVSHILAVEFTSCEKAFAWIGRHKYTHDIEVWQDSELLAVCPWTLCPHQGGENITPETRRARHRDKGLAAQP